MLQNLISAIMIISSQLELVHSPAMYCKVRADGLCTTPLLLGQLPDVVREQWGDRRDMV